MSLVLLPVLLAGMAAFLICEDAPEQTTVAIPFGGEEAYLRVKDLLNQQVDYAGVLDFVPNRLVERGVAPVHREIMQDMYDRLEIPEERRWIQPRQTQLFSDLLILLGEELEQDSLDSVIIVCNVYRSRWVKSKLADNLPPSQAERIFVVPVDPYDFTVWNWWRSSHGRRTVVTEFIDYLAYLLSDKKRTEEWPIRSPEELKKAALAAGNAG